MNPPVKPPIDLLSATVQLPLASLRGLQDYVAALEAYAASATERAPALPEAREVEAALRAAGEVVSFAAAHLHPSLPGMSAWPVAALMTVADALEKVQPDRARALWELAREVEAWNSYRTAKAARDALPCARCGAKGTAHTLIDGGPRRACGDKEFDPGQAMPEMP